MKTWKTLLIIGVLINVGIAVIQLMPETKEDKGRGPAEETEGHNDETGRIELSNESQELIGLKTIKAELSQFADKITVTGQIAQDAERTTHVVSSQAGTLARCSTEMGRVVNKGDVLCLVSTGGPADPAVEVRAPLSGVVISAFAREGDKVDSLTSLHTIADLSTMLATFDVYEKDISKIRVGQKISALSAAYPDERFRGEIIYVSPRVDEHTNTVKIRAQVSNPGYLLKLGMFVTADIIIESGERYIVVPHEAVHVMGDKKTVFIKTGDHDFEAREITVKKENRDEAAIERVRAGELVVVEDGFLLKSELLKSGMGEGCAD
ncbi:MAG TPA: efflux RND transporter periplasmic adaptor subunit [bacterium]|nr:efflux RND transporter periplasmic adaptor subunit [bacterium]